MHNYLQPLKSIIEIELPAQFAPETIPAEVFEKNIRLSDLAPDFLLIEAFFKYNDIDVLQGTNQIEKTTRKHQNHQCHHPHHNHLGPGHCHPTGSCSWSSYRIRS